MSDTQNPGGWPDAARPGVPMEPERDGAHVLMVGLDGMRIVHWHAAQQHYTTGPHGSPIPAEWMAAAHTGHRYYGLCLTPAEVAAREAAARREGFLAALEMAERRCEDAARYVRLRARSGEDHTVASTYEQAGAMVRALPVPDAFRAPTGLEYRGG